MVRSLVGGVTLPSGSVTPMLMFLLSMPGIVTLLPLGPDVGRIDALNAVGCQMTALNVNEFSGPHTWS